MLVFRGVQGKKRLPKHPHNFLPTKNNRNLDVVHQDDLIGHIVQFDSYTLAVFLGEWLLLVESRVDSWTENMENVLKTLCARYTPEKRTCPLKRDHVKRKGSFWKPSFFRGVILVFRGGYDMKHLSWWYYIDFISMGKSPLIVDPPSHPNESMFLKPFHPIPPCNSSLKVSRFCLTKSALGKLDATTHWEKKKLD